MTQFLNDVNEIVTAKYGEVAEILSKIVAVDEKVSAHRLVRLCLRPGLLTNFSSLTASLHP